MELKEVKYLDKLMPINENSQKMGIFRHKNNMYMVKPIK